MRRPDAPNVLPLEGEIDLHVSTSAAASLGTMIEQKPARLVVDLSRVNYIDSSGLAVLTEGMRNVEAEGGKFFLAGLRENAGPIFWDRPARSGFSSFSLNWMRRRPRAECGE